MGREMVLLLLKKGARVAAVDIQRAYLQETARLAGEHQSRLSTQVVNITDREVVAALPEEWIGIQGVVDGVINNAGIIQRFVPIKNLDLKSSERVFEVNFWRMVYVIKAFLPYLLKRPESHIVNISSMGGFLPVPGQTAYGASKAAVSLFTDGVHAELMDTPVQVTTVFPGAIATNIAANSAVGLNVAEMTEKNQAIKMTTAVEAAEIILAGMEKNKYHVYIGKDARIMSFLRRLAPQRAARLIHAQMRSLLLN